MTPPRPRHGLLLIDIQQGFDHPPHAGTPRSTPDFETNVAQLLALYRATAEPGDIFHVCHHSTSASSPLHPSRGHVGFQPYAAPLPGEPTFSKNVNSGFIGTGLEAAIRARGVTDLVVVGLTTDHCVSTTVRMAANLGVVPGRIRLVRDATAAYERSVDGRTHDAELVQSVHLASLNEEFCELVSTADLIREMESA
ncbi:isochorismatase [Diplodia corticola]|uniref:Isochorismatase n=1 Tax=Diplodia corticola TaxID=236234 RepID=A0A1J9RMJ8_9PEZI|nr:isochorismatase [Diplodia corticola]OJD33803.1 isochorismatase [Diplodia corticola]